MRKNKYGATVVYTDADLNVCEKGEHTYRFRSKLEYRFACRLKIEQRAGEVVDWEYEPDIFMLQDKQGRTKSYVPDFKVCRIPDRNKSRWTTNFYKWEYVEVKGHLKAGQRKWLKIAGEKLPHPLYVYSAKHEKLPVAEYLKKMRGKK